MPPDFSPLDALLQSPRAAALGGAVLHIRRGGAVLYERALRGFTLMQRENLASASKWLSAALLLRLCSDPALGPGLDQPVAQQLPGWGAGDPQKAHITLRMLLSHTSGLPGTAPAASAQDLDLLDSAMALGALELVHAPGCGFFYGECGYQVAGALAERASGLSLAAALEQYLCAPLGLQSLSFADAAGRLPRNPQLGAGVYGTAGEYVRVLEALLGSLAPDNPAPFIRPALARQMFSDQTAGLPLPFAYTPYVYIKALANSRYGLGCWRERVDADGGLIVAGSQGRWGASPWINLRQGVCGMLLLMDDYIEATPLYLQLHELLDEILAPT
jgi:CubicO group peptidase (beta-lactamase class C family)